MSSVNWGNEIYSVDYQSVKARGVSLEESELEGHLQGSVRTILTDPQGNSDIEAMLSSVVSAGFEKTALDNLLKDESSTPDWLVGEALAEAFVADNESCVFPWPSGRDLKNPEASATGADLVGFQSTGDEGKPYRFAFGEVKTSEEEKWPPQVVKSKSGLQKQLEDLRDSTKTKSGLFRYLGHHAKNSDWSEMYKSAASLYLKSKYEDASLFGILVRDVDPKDLDLKQRAINLSQNKPPNTSISLYSLYLPKKSICKLPEIVAA